MPNYEAKYYRLLDLAMNILAVMDLEQDGQVSLGRRKADRLYRMFKEQIEQETQTEE